MNLKATNHVFENELKRLITNYCVDTGLSISNIAIDNRLEPRHASTGGGIEICIKSIKYTTEQLNGYMCRQV